MAGRRLYLSLKRRKPAVAELTGIEKTRALFTPPEDDPPDAANRAALMQQLDAVFRLYQLVTRAADRLASAMSALRAFDNGGDLELGDPRFGLAAVASDGDCMPYLLRLIQILPGAPLSTNAPPDPNDGSTAYLLRLLQLLPAPLSKAATPDGDEIATQVRSVRARQWRTYRLGEALRTRCSMLRNLSQGIRVGYDPRMAVLRVAAANRQYDLIERIHSGEDLQSALAATTIENKTDVDGKEDRRYTSNDLSITTGLQSADAEEDFETMPADIGPTKQEILQLTDEQLAQALARRSRASIADAKTIIDAVRVNAAVMTEASKKLLKSKAKPPTAEPVEKSSRRNTRHVFTDKELRDPKAMDRALDVIADASAARRAGSPVSARQEEAVGRARALVRKLRQLDAT